MHKWRHTFTKCLELLSKNSYVVIFCTCETICNLISLFKTNLLLLFPLTSLLEIIKALSLSHLWKSFSFCNFLLKFFERSYFLPFPYDFNWFGHFPFFLQGGGEGVILKFGVKKAFFEKLQQCLVLTGSTMMLKREHFLQNISFHNINSQ